MDDRPIHLSEREEAVLDLIPDDGTPITSTELIELLYPNEEERPIHARSTLNARLRLIEEKLRRMSDGRRLEKGSRQGPHPITYWIKRIA